MKQQVKQECGYETAVATAVADQQMSVCCRCI
jgi:hypothetical protein